jgi:acyl dehydratase
LLIDQQRVTRFAEVTEDMQWIHVDEARAQRESPYGGTIAHGYLTLSLMPRLTNATIAIGGVRMGVNYGLNRVRFMAPVPVGRRIRARFTLLACEPLAGGGLEKAAQVIWQATVEVEGADKPACIAELVSRRYT